ncbi:MAG: choice-of-anchor J domain-containing protein [Bacteroidaceae bacterium]|nr:choice-of-anchor J domain-containing protein [Bacteroidaceae bacterium]
MKLFKKLAILAMTAFAFTDCEQVHTPYNLPGEGGGNGSGSETLSENLLENNDFETWENGKPAAWGLTVTNADIEQSNDAMSGTNAVIIKGYADSNKRFASKSYYLLPGTYYISAYIKQSGTTAGKFRMGYAKLTNGVAVDYTTDYQYLTNFIETTNEWSEVTANFELEETTEVAIMLVNSKSDAPVLVDDVTLKTIGGGLSEDEGDTPATPTNAYIYEPFTSNLGSFTTTEIIGSYPWEYAAQYKCAKVTGYSGVANAAESWLVSPSFDLTNETAAYISFDYVIAYNSDDIVACHQVMFSSDYNGNVENATWEAINYNPIKSGSWVLENTGKIAIPESMYGKSNVTVAFKYTSSASNASTWEVANVRVAPGDGSDTPDGGGDTPSIPGEQTTIANAIEAGPGAAKVSGTVLATYARGFIVNDGTASILVYLGSEHSYVAGDVVTVEGTTSEYAGMLQFGSGTSVEKTGTESVSHPTVSVMSAADMDAYLSAPVIKYVQYTGKLTINGYYYNVEISGATKAMGSISYPAAGMVDASLDGKEITVTGYTIGVSSSKYVNTMAVSVVAADGSTTPDDGGDEGDDEGGITEPVVFDFTNPTSLTPSITPAEKGKGVEFDEVTFTNGDVTITALKNDATTKVRIWTKNDLTTEFRSYNKSTITISGKGMKKIVFDGNKVSTMTTTTGTLSEGTWTGNADSVTFNVTGTLNINTITVE